MKEPRNECTHPSICEYFKTAEMYDTWKEKFNVWWCTCEEEMCAGCIPTYKKSKVKEQVK